ncbi:MAG: tetratricopeptide repeat protein [Treponemataceae bacterium]
MKKIYTVKFLDMLANMEHTCIANGGSFFKQSNKYYFYFNSKILAPEFSSIRFLFLLQELFNKNLFFIESFKLLVDKTPSTFDEVEIENYFDKTRNILFEENLFYVTKKLYQTFSDYVRLDNTSENISKILEFTIFENIKEQNSEKKQLPSIVLHRKDSFFWVLYNFILQNPICDDDLKYLTNDEKFSFNQVKPSMLYFKKHRFEKDLPEYFVDAFLLYVSLYFKIYQRLNSGKLPIIFSGDLRNEQLNTELQKILIIIPEAEVRELPKKIPSISKIPEGMLSLVFLTTIFSRYLFIDELSTFFTSLNKSPDFFSDICAWLYANEIIFEPNNLYAHSTHLSDFIENKIGAKTQELYDKLASFLVSAYKAGEIAPSNEFVTIVRSMNYTKTDSILLSVFLHTASSEKIIETDIESSFKNTAFFDGLKHYQKALKLFESFSNEKSLNEIKLAISEFKYKRFLVGEYKCMLFLGNSSLRRFDLNDAINYFSYALDIANKLNDSEFLCEVLFSLGVTYFLKNDLTLALNNFKSLDETIEKNFRQNWKVKTLFMMGRVYSQLGEYKKAEDFFTRAGNFANQYFTDFLPVCEIWQAFMLSHQAQNIQAQKIFNKYIGINFDAVVLFLLSFFTSPILADETEKIFSVDVSKFSCEDLLHSVKSKIKKSPENKSGFSFGEDLILKTKDSLTTAEKLFQIFLLYYRAKVLIVNILANKNKEKLENILQQMSILANEAANEKSIYAHWYFYFCADISAKLNGENSSEAVSFLGKSFKLLQSRVILTSENEVRDKYMNKNYWNAKILEVAKTQKLL